VGGQGNETERGADHWYAKQSDGASQQNGRWCEENLDVPTCSDSVQSAGQTHCSGSSIADDSTDGGDGEGCVEEVVGLEVRDAGER